MSSQTTPQGALSYPLDLLRVESLDLEGQGIAHRPDGKVVFIEGALPFEHVTANVFRKKDQWEKATLTHICKESAQRVVPNCPHFGMHTGACGGCKMQHLHAGAQIAIKQRVLEDNLWHLGKVKPEQMLRPIEGPAWGYRYRARLSVRYVVKKDEVLIGFHERKSRYVADMKSCAVLPPHVSALLMPLRKLIQGMAARDTLPQIELACGEDITALVLRHLEPLREDDKNKLRAFAHTHAHCNIQWWLQAKGPDTICLLEAPFASEAYTSTSTEQLCYTLPEYAMTMPFRPTDFTQVNPHINRVLVTRTLRLLEVGKSERVIDWFCGLGNFTLPLATQAREVLGVEGSNALVERSRENFQKNQLHRPPGQPLCTTDFVARDLFEMTPEMLAQDGTADKWLIDPPREGAFALVKALTQLIQNTQNEPHWQPPKRIVYVSCNPATLARDAQVLVHQGSYRCVAAGMVNMFPHTAHVESMAVFDLD